MSRPPASTPVGSHPPTQWSGLLGARHPPPQPPRAPRRLHAYNLAGEPVIYMQVSVPDSMPVFLASHANRSKRITAYVETYVKLSVVVDLLHDHRLTGGIDVETCRFVAKRTSGTTITDAEFDQEATVSGVLSRLSHLEGKRIKHLTFVPSFDGHVHIIADFCHEPTANTLMYPRKTFVKRCQPVGEREGAVTLEATKRELCVNEYSHPPHPALFQRSVQTE